MVQLQQVLGPELSQRLGDLPIEQLGKVYMRFMVDGDDEYTTKDFFKIGQHNLNSVDINQAVFIKLNDSF